MLLMVEIVALMLRFGTAEGWLLDAV